MDVTKPGLLFSRAKDQLSCEIDGEIAILCLKSKLYFGLTEVGATIWRALEVPQAYETLVATIMAKYDVDAERCQHDAREFLALLQERGLLEVEGKVS